MNLKSGLMKILKTGPGTSVQDLGRSNLSHWGIPISGVADQKSAGWVNHLLQNRKESAVLEISQPGLSLSFSDPTIICIAGASALVKLNGKETHPSGLIYPESGDVLDIGPFYTGARVYLGIKGGFQSEERLSSKSWYQGITSLEYAKKGTELPYLAVPSPFFPFYAKAKWNTSWFEKTELEVFPGPDWDLLSKQEKNLILTHRFTVSSLANRMAVQLQDLVPNSLPELPTNPVYPGTIQLTSGGKLLLLMKDAQVTGGYPRILQIEEESQWILAQKKPGDQLEFSLKRP